MKIYGKDIPLGKAICLALYYGIAQFLPTKAGRAVRYSLCRRIFRHCGQNVHIERRAHFGNGLKVEIGDNSGIGPHARIPNDTIIGNCVMMGPNCHIYDRNHITADLSKPMCMQGSSAPLQTVIGDDVWIGTDVFMTPGRHVASHSIIAAHCVLTKDFPEYSVVGGNPSRILKDRRL